MATLLPLSKGKNFSVCSAPVFIDVFEAVFCTSFGFGVAHKVKIVTISIKDQLA
jgi:hypothetical protein